MSKHPKQFYEFGPFRIDADSRSLLREGQLVPLPPKIADLLFVLVQNRGQVVSKEELLKTVWPDTIVEESNLTVSMSALRRALGESAEQKYIETLSKRGYRFVAQVKERCDEDEKLVVDGRTLSSVNHSLPHQLTSFIGREQEMAEIKRLLSATRLLTLTGAGGCGKTRLAIEVAAGLLENYADGVWLVELAALSDPARVAQTAASALSLREEPGRALADTLADFLRAKSLLLILDNCEHLIAACAQMAETLLRACPELRILATSREALGVAGETAWRVPSLSLPDPQSVPSLEQLTQYEATRLFIERAKSAELSFAVTERDAPALAQVCHRLDGIPLAIELAAARVKVLMVEQIAARLDDRFRLLTVGSRTALPRHQTLRALIDWSYALLEETERTLLRRLAVFAGGWTLSAAETVCAGEGIEEREVLDLLSQLVDKSLVLVGQSAEGQARYRLLETVRQYGREKLLESGEGERIRDRHLDFYLKLAIAAEPESQGAQGELWLDRLEEEHDNLRLALDWAFETDVEKGLQLAGSLYPLWVFRGYLSEGQERLTTILSRAGTGESAAARMKAFFSAAWVMWMQGDHARAAALAEQSLTLARQVGDQRMTAYSLLGIGVCYLDAEGDYEWAVALLEESLALARQMRDKFLVSLVLVNLGSPAALQGDYGRAAALLEESLVLAREVGHKWLLAVSLANSGFLALHQREYDRAMALAKESLALRRELQDKWGVMQCLEIVMAGVSAAQGQPERAARLLGAAEAIRETIGASLQPVLRNEHESNKAAIRKALGEEAFRAARAEGRAMTLEQAIAYALEEVTDD